MICNNLIPNFVASLLLLGRHCPQFLVFLLYIAHRICFFHPFFCRRNLASREKIYAERHLQYSFPFNEKRMYNDGW